MQKRGAFVRYPSTKQAYTLNKYTPQNHPSRGAVLAQWPEPPMNSVMFFSWSFSGDVVEIGSELIILSGLFRFTQKLACGNVPYAYCGEVKKQQLCIRRLLYRVSPFFRVWSVTSTYGRWDRFSDAFYNVLLYHIWYNMQCFAGREQDHEQHVVNSCNFQCARNRNNNLCFYLGDL